MSKNLCDAVPAGTAVFSRARDAVQRSAKHFAYDLGLPFDPAPERRHPALAGTLHFPEARLLIAGTGLPRPFLLNSGLQLAEAADCDLVLLRQDAGLVSYDVIAADHHSANRRAFQGYRFVSYEGPGGLLVPADTTHPAWHIAADGLRAQPASPQAIASAYGMELCAA